MPYLEHVNLTVRDPERTAALMARLFGWHVRWSGPAQMGGRTVHVGDDRCYLALYTLEGEATPAERFVKGRPFNHVGVLVEDLDAIEARVVAEGLKPFSHGDYDPGRRFYFLDYDGSEFEVVSYR
ncbi:VOC family protein [Sphingomonas canadensis]|uniref:VOC family protein n=1 Tax=Sphingomonas canadensis TaxID=1219257 RepID=A0ABW3H8K4_9SPHN|nr:VOC family protein [Sphingomonas canadensis]MCW3837538.1 VOC family protein [Sphingomonas canadensis]